MIFCMSVEIRQCQFSVKICLTSSTFTPSLSRSHEVDDGLSGRCSERVCAAADQPAAVSYEEQQESRWQSSWQPGGAAGHTHSGNIEPLAPRLTAYGGSQVASAPFVSSQSSTSAALNSCTASHLFSDLRQLGKLQKIDISFFETVIFV